MAFVIRPSVSLTGAAASDLFGGDGAGARDVSLRALGKARLGTRGRGLFVAAKLRKVKKHEYPWPEDPDPNVKGGLLSHLSHFKPLKEKPKPVTLEFEKPLMLFPQSAHENLHVPCGPVENSEAHLLFCRRLPICSPPHRNSSRRPWRASE